MPGIRQTDAALEATSRQLLDVPRAFRPWRSRRPQGLHHSSAYSRRAAASMRSAGSTTACASPLLRIVKPTGMPLTDIEPWVRYLYSPGLGARSVAEK